ncbi:MAG: glycogen debranching enzyme family protein [Pedosphaera sp.]|nr:glycogen debranching enzyme family protein [Pedosphaera sp.]
MKDIIEVKGNYYIRANASMADAGSRVLKHADTFAIFDRHGDIRPLGFENQGVFHGGTRFVSRWKLAINWTSPLLLSSNVKEDNDFLVVDLTNPVLHLADGQLLPDGVIHLVRNAFLWEGDYFERLEISNFTSQPVSLGLELDFGADYLDVFEVRGTERKQRGRLLPPVVDHNQVVLAYEGLDAVVRRTLIHFSTPAKEISSERAVFQLDLAAQEQKGIEIKVSCLIEKDGMDAETFEGAFDKVHAAYQDYRKDITLIETSNPQFNDWINQSRADLHMLLTQTDCGPYPYAGIPWFSCIFGRDGIVTALETLWLNTEIARGVFSYLATRQASEMNPTSDAEPGKILHEERDGEMADLKEVPFGCYYGSVDSTPLWLMLAGAYYERTGDKELIAHFWPNIQRALAWIDCYGDCDGDGFVEYRPNAAGGLTNQGWKDSDDAVFHADGTLPVPPIALCEVQGYVYEAKRSAALLAEALGHREEAEELRQAAERLKTRFHEAFWCEEIQTYALALDGAKRPCRVRSSNAGQCLFSGIAQSEAAAQIKAGLLGETFFTGWGMRTIGSLEARYNPLSYHNGSVWPHDNALIASGFARYGFKDAALSILTALFDASRFMELNRLPELYCGFRRRRGEGPTLYPVACNPQAWSSASVSFLIQSCLGLRIDAPAARVYFDNPHLPESIHNLKINNLKVASGVLDISLVRYAENVAVNVRRRVGKVEVVVIH